MIKEDNVFIFRMYRKETVTEINVAGKTGQPLVKNETRSLSNTTHKNKLKVD